MISVFDFFELIKQRLFIDAGENGDGDYDCGVWDGYAWCNSTLLGQMFTKRLSVDGFRAEFPSNIFGVYISKFFFSKGSVKNCKSSWNEIFSFSVLSFV